MTRDDWTNGEVDDLLTHTAIPHRKLRLFAVACCRRIWHLLTDERSRRAVEVAELFADDLVAKKVMGEAWTAALAASCDDYPAFYAVTNATAHAHLPNFSTSVIAATCFAADAVAGRLFSGNTPERQAQADLLREIVNSFAVPVNAGPVSRRIAESIYVRQAFDELGVLADVIEEENVSDQELLTHLRTPGDHVKGCWALDLVLGR